MLLLGLLLLNCYLPVTIASDGKVVQTAHETVPRRMSDQDDGTGTDAGEDSKVAGNDKHIEKYSFFHGKMIF